MDIDNDVETDVAAFRSLGAPVLLVCHNGAMQWWQQGVERPRQIGPAVGPGEIDEFFEIHREEFSPSAIYRAKTWGRFDREHQLTFVDLGLMQVVEEESGRELGRLIAPSQRGSLEVRVEMAQSRQPPGSLVAPVDLLVSGGKDP